MFVPFCEVRPEWSQIDHQLREGVSFALRNIHTSGYPVQEIRKTSNELHLTLVATFGVSGQSVLPFRNLVDCVICILLYLPDVSTNSRNKFAARTIRSVLELE